MSHDHTTEDITRMFTQEFWDARYSSAATWCRCSSCTCPGQLFFTAEEMAAQLAHQDWQIVVAAAAERGALDPDGQPVTIRDAVLHALRLR